MNSCYTKEIIMLIAMKRAYTMRITAKTITVELFNKCKANQKILSRIEIILAYNVNLCLNVISFCHILSMSK